MIKLETVNKQLHKVYFNTKYLGEMIMDESGFFNFIPEGGKSGMWSSYSLRLIADKLDEINKEWSDYIIKNIR